MARVEDPLKGLPSRNSANFANYSHASAKTAKKTPVYIKTIDSADATPEGLAIKPEKTSVLLQYMQKMKNERKEPKKRPATTKENGKANKCARVDEETKQSD